MNLGFSMVFGSPAAALKRQLAWSVRLVRKEGKHFPQHCGNEMGTDVLAHYFCLCAGFSRDTSRFAGERWFARLPAGFAQG